MNYGDRISLDSDVQHGKPVVSGTRITVSKLVGSVAAGMSVAETANAYGVTDSDVQAALQFAADLISEEEFHPIPH